MFNMGLLVSYVVGRVSSRRGVVRYAVDGLRLSSSTAHHTHSQYQFPDVALNKCGSTFEQLLSTLRCQHEIAAARTKILKSRAFSNLSMPPALTRGALTSVRTILRILRSMQGPSSAVKYRFQLSLVMIGRGKQVV